MPSHGSPKVILSSVTKKIRKSVCLKPMIKVPCFSLRNEWCFQVFFSPLYNYFHSFLIKASISVMFAAKTTVSLGMSYWLKDVIKVPQTHVYTPIRG